MVKRLCHQLIFSYFLILDLYKLKKEGCYIRCILRCAITVVLILGAVVLVLIVLVLVVFTLILYKRCVDLLFGALLLTDYQI